MFLSFQKSTGTYWIRYKNELTGKYNRWNTHTADEELAKTELKTFTPPVKSLVTSKAVNLMMVDDSDAAFLKECYNKIYDYYCTNNYKNKYNVNFVFDNLKKCFGNNLNLNKLSALQIEQFKRFLLNSNFGESTINHHLRNLKAYLNKLKFWELITIDIAGKIKLFKNCEKERLNFTDEEIKYIFENIQNPLFLNICKTALLTGMRKAELTHLQWSDVDFINKQIKVINKENHKTKSRKNRYIPIKDNLNSLLIEMYKKDNFKNYVFTCKSGSKLNDDYASTCFTRLRKQLNLNSDLCFHSFRHSFAVNYLKATNNIYGLQIILGHQSIQTSMIYLHSNTSELLDGMNKMKVAF
ncbi:MAG: site-specific integrase [Ignavibacteria bacterium]|nr:site-specific integrase [Ignavibacteria bacterium]